MNRSVAIVLSILVAIAMAHQARLFFLSFQPPFSDESAIAINPNLKSGEPLSIRYKFKRNRFCDSRINWYVVRKDNDEVVWRQQVIGGATLLGPQNVINQITLPKLPPAEYVMHTISLSICTEGQHVLIFPDVEFTVSAP